MSPSTGSSLCLQMLLLEQDYFLNKHQKKYVSISLDAEPTPRVKIACLSRCVVMKRRMWFFVMSKDCVSTVRTFDDCTLDVCRGRYLRIIHISYKMILGEAEWTYLIHLAFRCLNWQLHKPNISCHDLKQWQDKIHNCKEFCLSKSTKLIHSETLFDERLCNKY